MIPSLLTCHRVTPVLILIHLGQTVFLDQDWYHVKSNYQANNTPKCNHNHASLPAQSYAIEVQIEEAITTPFVIFQAAILHTMCYSMFFSSFHKNNIYI